MQEQKQKQVLPDLPDEDNLSDDSQLDIKDIMQQQQSEKNQSQQIPFSRFFRYLRFWDKVMLGIGIVSCILAGCLVPSFALIMASVAQAFTKKEDGSSDPTEIQETMNFIAAYVILVAVGLFLFCYLFFAFWQHLAENITTDLKKRYLKALLSQEIAFFEERKVEQIPIQMFEIFEVIKGTIGEKVAILVFSVASCIAGFLYGFVFSPIYSLLCLAYLPFLFLIMGGFGFVVQSTTLQKLTISKHLGGIAEESLALIKVVAGFGREEKELKKFAKWTYRTRKLSRKQTMMYSFMVGIMKCTIFTFYVYAILVGSFFIQFQTENKATGEYYTQRDILVPLIAFITGLVGLIGALPNLQQLIAAKTLGKLVFDVIDRSPTVRDQEDCIIGQGISLKNEISFENITFKYPTAPPEFKPVLENASFKIKAGQSTAIVGPSGSGKSTIVQLIERFYDPSCGTIKFDEQEIQSISLRDLRENIGYVSQEPIMILGTIKDNLLYGNRDATEEQCCDALRKAEAGFVFDLESGINTSVSSAGITGGQKQCIAIARALIKNPTILILDEATSSLDPRSELEVQAAIDSISQAGLGLTIVMIAHRLSTIATADNLLYFQSRSNLLSASKGTPEYNEIFTKLKAIEATYGDNDEEDSEEEEFYMSYQSQQNIHDYVSEQDIIEEEDENAAQSDGEDKLLTENHVVKVNEIELMDSEPRMSFDKKANNSKDLIGKNKLKQQEELSEAYRMESEYSDKHNNMASLAQNINSINSASKSKTFFSQAKTPTISKRELDVTAVPPKTSKSPMLIDSNPIRRNSSVSGNRSPQQSVGSSKKINSMSSFSDLTSSIQTALPPELTYADVSDKQLMEYYTPKWLSYAGIIFSIIAAAQLPSFGFAVGNLMFIIALPVETEEQIEIFSNERYKWILILFGIVVAVGISSFLQRLSFGYGGDNLACTLRLKLFSAILTKHLSWHESTDKSPGVLTNVLIDDISTVNGLTSEVRGLQLEGIFGMVISTVICAFFSWQLAIVTFFVNPFLIASGLLTARVQFGKGQEADESHRKATSLLSNIIMNYRTVIGFGEKNVDYILERYGEFLIFPTETGIKKAHMAGLAFGYANSIRLVYIAFIFYMASIFIERYDLDSQQVFIGCYVVFVGSIGSGVALGQVPSISKAKSSAKTVFGMINDESQIDPNQVGHTEIPNGRIEFRNVRFKYPTGKKWVLRKFNLSIEPNTSVAIVGHSGSGKSTIGQLILRFYDATKGQVIIDGHDIRSYSTKNLRKNISIVQQEPLLFNDSIRDNILYGDMSASDKKVRDVAAKANALGFIMQKEEDYNSEAVQEKAVQEFRQVLRSGVVSDSRRFKKIHSVPKLAAQGDLGYRELSMIGDLLPYINSDGLSEIEEKFELFIQAVEHKAKKTDATWMEILKYFYFMPDLQAINQYLEEEQQLSQEQVQEVKVALQINVGQFDLKTVQNWVKHESKIQGQNEKRLIAFIKQDKAKIELAHQETLDSHINHDKVASDENTLHPGFDKVCGLKGSKLSGGQKQRVAIARALIKNPKILILDEATSALDEQSQDIVQQALEKAMQGRTSIVIAHRMSTIQKCNRIVVINRGRIIEDGTFEELSAKEDGHFAKLKAGIN